MLLSDRGFPFEALRPEDTQTIRAFCGVEAPEHQITDTEYARQFLQFSGHNFALGQNRPFVENLFVNLRKRALQVVGDTCPEAERSYNRGLFFYSGVLSVASKAETWPYNEQVIVRFQDEDPRLLTGGSLTAIEYEAPSFCSLLQDARTALEIENDDLYRLSLIGAGTMHMLVTESVKEVLNPDITALEAMHPELADLAWPDEL